MKKEGETRLNNSYPAIIFKFMCIFKKKKTLFFFLIRLS